MAQSKPDFVMDLPELDSIPTPDLRPIRPVKPIGPIEIPKKMLQHTEIIYDHFPSEALQWIKPQQKKKGHFALLPEDEIALGNQLQREVGVTAEYSKEIKTKDRKSVPDVTLTKDNRIVCKVHFKLYNKKDEFNQGKWYIWLFFYDFLNNAQMEEINKCMISFFKGHIMKELPKELPKDLSKDLPKALPKDLPKALPMQRKRYSTKKHKYNQRKNLIRNLAITKRHHHVA